MLEIILLLAFSALCGWGAYVGFKERKRVKDEYDNAVTVANTQKADALSKNKPLMRANYNSIKNSLNIPFDCDKIDVETTVFGLPCKAEALVGKHYLLSNDFYCWNENDPVYIFPAGQHLEE